jgi:hypothetical protein
LNIVFRRFIFIYIQNFRPVGLFIFYLSIWLFRLELFGSLMCVPWLDFRPISQGYRVMGGGGGRLKGLRQIVLQMNYIDLPLASQ